nr:DNA-directed DNA polymerase [Tanacetum cinerariifolium]
MSLLQALEKRKGAIAWKMSDIKEISLSYYTHKILGEDDYKPVIQPQRRLNLKVQDVVKNEIMKLLDSGLIYPISDSLWVSPIHVVPKKGGMTIVLNDNNELILSRTVTGWRVCIDYHKLNDAIRKDHFPTPFIDQMLERLYFMEVFMEYFLVFGNSFDCRLANLDMMLARCEETNLVSNYKKCHFMVKEGIVLGQKIYGARIEVDRAKIDVIAKLQYPTNEKRVRSFLGRAGFYRMFIKDFYMISKSMTQLLMKDTKFDFSDDCKKAFNILKEKLTTMSIIISPNWNVPFELMCDASDFAVGAVLGQRIDVKFKLIYYARKTLNNAQDHYTTTEKEILVVLFSFDKFCPYLILSKTIVYTDHSASKYLFSKQDAKPRIIRLENPDLGTFMEEDIADNFHDEHFMILKTKLNEDEPWFADYVNYILGKIVPPNWTPEKRKRFFSQVKNCFWDEPYAFKLCPDNIMRRCVAGDEIHEILEHCHSGPTGDNIMRRCVAGDKIHEILAHCHSGPTGGHHSASITGRKVYESGFFWPSIFKDAKDYVMICDACQRSGNISSGSEMP